MLAEARKEGLLQTFNREMRGSGAPNVKKEQAPGSEEPVDMVFKVLNY